MQVNLNIPVKNIDGTVIEGQTVGQILANALVTQSKGDVLKIYGWGINLAANEPLELDESDKQLFKTMVTDLETVTILLKGPVLQELLK
jgi:hypothetical protein